MGRRLGVMGGTFDPVHHGHLVTAEEAYWQFGLDEVMFVPTGRPWMKAQRHIAGPEYRYQMVVMATSNNPHFSVSRAEIERDGPTHTVDTLLQLHAQGEDDLYFVTGADAIADISEWNDFPEFLSLATFIAASRPGYEFPPDLPGAVQTMSIPALAISSTDIRERVAAGRPIRYLVPDDVGAFIEKEGFYR